MRPALAADPGQLHAAKRGAQVAQEPVVDPGDTDFHLSRHAMRALQVRGPDRGREPVAGVIGHVDGLLLGIKRRQVAHRAEDFLADTARAFSEAGEYRRFYEGALVAL